MGAWSFVKSRIENLVGRKVKTMIYHQNFFEQSAEEVSH